ncbi:hypothetical protein D9757_014464 [Collybiopsis confluens]|uniref:Uncharacterized protein n=1 Tax=Collybiopsis confluens TaxID=2823264 RepID=A0A8H5CW22_9AGAR|nr:hypothetical protein D9757_014464 [Collybiopsis confluens]
MDTPCHRYKAIFVVRHLWQWLGQELPDNIPSEPAEFEVLGSEKTREIPRMLDGRKYVLTAEARKKLIILGIQDRLGTLQFDWFVRNSSLHLDFTYFFFDLSEVEDVNTNQHGLRSYRLSTPERHRSTLVSPDVLDIY